LGAAGFRGKEGIMQRIAILLVMAVIVAGCAAPSVAVVEAPAGPSPTRGGESGQDTGGSRFFVHE
jgi:hypothetical protein